MLIGLGHSIYESAWVIPQVGIGPHLHNSNMIMAANVGGPLAYDKSLNERHRGAVGGVLSAMSAACISGTNSTSLSRIDIPLSQPPLQIHPSGPTTSPDLPPLQMHPFAPTTPVEPPSTLCIQRRPQLKPERPCQSLLQKSSSQQSCLQPATSTT